MSADAGAVRINGIDDPLPEGERLLWQGAPDWRALAVRRFHARKIGVYFLLLVGWRGATAPAEAEPLAYFVSGASWLLVLGALAVGAAYLFAALVARTSTYAVTDRRVVMRVGVALPTVLNIPLRLVASAQHRPYAGGSGDLALGLEPENQLAWLLLWPHARPWRFRAPEPTLLCVPRSDAVGELLREALAAGVEASPAPQPAAEPSMAHSYAPRTLASVP